MPHIHHFLFLFTGILLMSCTNKPYHARDKYIVLDKEGLSLTVHSTLWYKQEPNSDQLKENLDTAKRLCRHELGLYHIIEPCITNKDSIWKDVANKIDKSLQNQAHYQYFQIDSISIDKWTKNSIVRKFGEKYRLK